MSTLMGTSWIYADPKVTPQEVTETLISSFQAKILSSPEDSDSTLEMVAVFQGFPAAIVLDSSCKTYGHQFIFIASPEFKGKESIEKNACLKFQVLSFGEGEISEINVRSRTDGERNLCPGPTERSGQYFMEISHEIARQLQLTRIRLQDVSQIYCKKSDSILYLKTLGILLHGKGWYERLGFGPKIDPKEAEEIPAELLQRILNAPNALQNLTLEVIRKELTDALPEVRKRAENPSELSPDLPVSDPSQFVPKTETQLYWSSFQKRLEIFEATLGRYQDQLQIQSSSSIDISKHTLSEFMRWLHQRDLSHCDEVEAILSIAFIHPYHGPTLVKEWAIDHFSWYREFFYYFLLHFNLVKNL